MMLVALVIIGLTAFAFADYLLAHLRPEAPSLWRLFRLPLRRRPRPETELAMTEAKPAFEDAA
jgi:hypothetical protein